MEHLPINQDTVSGLDLDYTFELIPDCPAATNAGYTTEDRRRAQVWYSPIYDQKYFYYTAWSGSILDPSHKSSILVCRRKTDGALRYAVNCSDYNLDTSPNFVGDGTTICRTKLLMLGHTLYLCNAVMSNIGPQVYAVNKKNGNLRWAAAYYTPEGAPEYITERGDYSQYQGSNHRLSDLCPNGGYYTINGVKGKYIFVGTSSLQNAINVGLITSGQEIYTDQGFLFCIRDMGNASKLIWKTPTSAPLLKTGDVLIKGGNPIYDPFAPLEDTVIIQSLTSDQNYFVQPAFLPTGSVEPNGCPIISQVSFNSETVINRNLVQPIWRLGFRIYEGNDRTISYTLNELIVKWRMIQQQLAPGETYSTYIWAFVDSTTIEAARLQSGNTNILYFKQYYPDQAIMNDFDAQGLNFWGNSTWGASVHIDEERNLIYFGSGQAHAQPISEDIYYSNPSRNFRTLKANVIDVIDQYSKGTASLLLLNASKLNFVERIRLECLNVGVRSPRSQMSYSDGFFGVYMSNTGSAKGGQLAFASRTVPWDTYSFLNTQSLAAYPIKSLDGDVSSGVMYHNGILSTPAKSGISSFADISNLTHVKFNHHNLEETGVNYFKLTFSGPNGALGGSNYQAALSNSGQLISSQGNMSWFDGCVSNNGTLERAVSVDGRIFDINNSFAQGIDSQSGNILWETDLNNRVHTQITSYRNLSFLADGNGSLYVLGNDGKIIWKYNGSKNKMYGGINSPAVDGNQVFWTNSYSAFGIIGTPSPNGCVFKVNSKRIVGRKVNLRRVLGNKHFTSWDTAPKMTVDQNPAIEPINSFEMLNSWKCSDRGRLVVDLVYKGINAPQALYGRAKVKDYNSRGKIITFKCDPSQMIKIHFVELINSTTYKLVFHLDVDGMVSDTLTAWLERT